MDKLDYWHLCDELTVAQAALLIAGYDPAQRLLVMYEDVFERPEKFTATLTALVHAILGGRLHANLSHEPIWDPEANTMVQQDSGEPNWDKTTVFVEDLKKWLSSRGINSGFFFPQPSETCVSKTPGYLDSTHSHYAPKLAAAIAAWHAVDANPELTRGKTPKQALEEWLEKHAEQFGLVNEKDGTLNAGGITETAKTSNWDLKGGVPPTPTKR